MRRPLLVSALVLGLVASALSASGTWATFDDSARSEEISITSGAVPNGGGGDLIRILRTPYPECSGNPDAYVDGYDDADPIVLEVNADGTSDGTAYQEALTVYTCIRNMSSSTVSLYLSTEILDSSDPYCSGTEADVPGETCGTTLSGGPTPGELADAYTLTARRGASYRGPCNNSDTATLAALAADVGPLRCENGHYDQDHLVIEPGHIFQLELSLAYDPGFGGRDAVMMARVAQTDRLTFRYLFSADIAP